MTNINSLATTSLFLSKRFIVPFLLSYTVPIVFSHIATSYDSILNRRPLADLFGTGSRLKTVQVSWLRCNASAPKISFGPGPATCAPARTLCPRLLALEIGA